MSFRLRIIMLAVLPFLLVTGTVTWISFKEVKYLSEEQIKIFNEKLLQSKKNALKDYMDLALSAINPVIEDTSLNKKVAQEVVKRILNGLRFGKDGYFYVYDHQGINLVHPIQSDLVGKNLYNTSDKRGDRVIKVLLDVAEKGGGYHQYYWNKPSARIEEQKIAYVVKLPRWDWMVGSGLYIDDITAEEQVIRQQIDENIKRNIAIILLIVILTTFIIILFMVYINLHEGRLANRRIRELAQNFVKLQIQERRNFSRELHDGINQLMAAVKFRMELAMSQLKKTSEPDCDIDNLTKGLEVLKEAIQEVRRISHALRPGLLDQMGLRVSLQELCDQFQERTHIEIKSEIHLDTALRLPDDIEITLYRVVQEALTNIERHSNATQCTLELKQYDARVKLVLMDDGRGYSTDVKTAGLGLTNMRERVELLGGDFVVESEPNRGVRISVTLPYSLSGKLN